MEKNEMFIGPLLILFLPHFIVSRKLIFSLSSTLSIFWLFSLFNLILWQFYISLSITLALVLLVYSIDYLKYKTLKEHFSYEDIFLYIQVFRFPSFYVPYVGKVKFFTISFFTFILISIAIYLSFQLRAPFNLKDLLYYLLCFVTPSFIIFTYAKYNPIETDFESMIQKHGLLMSILLYALERKNENYQSPTLTNTNQPNRIIAVQSESFFFTDELKTHYEPSAISGILKVPSYGAYTMRTEYAFLTGIANENLNNQYFNPYRKCYKNMTHDYVKQLKEQGYYCVAIHPFKRHFFNRKRVFEKLGFDCFIDEKEFSKDDIFTTDQQLTEFVINYLNTYQKHKKLFVFIITVAAHGPYTLLRNDPIIHHNQSSNNEINTYLDLNYKAYQMFKKIKKILKEDDLFIFYGDHKPSLNAYNFQDNTLFQTNYLITGKNHTEKANFSDLTVENLLQSALDFYNKA